MVLCLGLFLSISNLGDKRLIFFDLINNIKYHRTIIWSISKKYYSTTAQEGTNATTSSI